MDSIDQILPVPAIMTPAFLIILAKCSSLSTRFGGLKFPEQASVRTKMVDFTCSLLRASCESPYYIDICLDADWVMQWPRPSSSWRAVSSFKVEADATVNLEAWKNADMDLQCEESRACRGRWVRSLAKYLVPSGGEKLDLCRFALEGEK